MKKITAFFIALLILSIILMIISFVQSTKNVSRAYGLIGPFSVVLFLVSAAGVFGSLVGFKKIEPAEQVGPVEVKFQ